MQSSTPGSIEIRPASVSDSLALARLFDRYRQFYGYDADLAKAERFISERLRAMDSHLFIASRGAENCGFVQCYPGFASLECRPSWLLSDLYVDETARRLGVGQALLEYVRECAGEADCCLIELFTARSNSAAQQLYQSAGYAEDREFLHYELLLQDG
ncbi:GNAT family N-acetyltransferase [Marinobacterium lutimaris]|uniref:Acetyltransferase (GNAT) family protein n=1 Tax=Marinobacterium lutimaris TaxID=568106 RepID=A0A1H5UYJ3_9GAMM|nr:GNAT family N-acetyltransferase [Marinobacterium lutimaris]SEF80044.1 Acetyltransferase (GNAT) family protein [Marinobacterium lutimaris]